MGIFTKKEVRALVVSILVLAVIFGLDDKRAVFELRYWLANFVLVILGVTFALLLREVVKKFVAGRYGCKTEFEIWSVRRIWFSKGALLKKYGIPLGIIFGLYFSLISLGKFYFAAISLTRVEAERIKRVGKMFTRLTEFEESFILFIGAMVSLVLALIFNLFSSINLSIFVTINKWIALFTFLPIPNLDGFRMFIGSRTLYVFGLLTTILCFIFISYLNPLLSLSLGVLISIIVTLIYFFVVEYER
jgi:hypothetical protein